MIVFILMGSGLVFSACGENGIKGYDMTQLATDYTNQISSINNVSLTTNHGIEFDYSIYSTNGNQYMLQAINHAPYSYIQTYYNTMLNNSMAFVYSFIDVCSSSIIEVPKDLKNEVKQDLDQFVLSLKKTSGNVEAVADKIRKGNDIMSTDSLNSLKNLFDSYEELYQSAFNFSSTLANVYYGYAYTNSNPDYSNTKLEDYDASKTILLLKSRIKHHIANYTQSYIEINLKGSNLSRRFTTVGNIAELPNNFSQYKSKINAINYEVDDSKGSSINDSGEKENFMNSAIALYNCISILDNNYPIYHKASNDVVYNKVISDVNASRYEKDCAQIIKNNEYVLNEINAVIARMVNIINSI